jgi:hypothetical protein
MLTDIFVTSYFLTGTIPRALRFSDNNTTSRLIKLLCGCWFVVQAQPPAKYLSPSTHIAACWCELNELTETRENLSPVRSSSDNNLGQRANFLDVGK